MPVIRNLTRQVLHLHRIGRVIDPDASLTVTDAEAAQLAGHPLLGGVPPAPDPSAPEPDPVPAKPAKPAKAAKPTKTTKEGDEQ